VRCRSAAVAAAKTPLEEAERPGQQRQGAAERARIDLGDRCIVEREPQLAGQLTEGQQLTADDRRPHATDAREGEPGVAAAPRAPDRAEVALRRAGEGEQVESRPVGEGKAVGEVETLNAPGCSVPERVTVPPEAPPNVTVSPSVKVLASPVQSVDEVFQGGLKLRHF